MAVYLDHAATTPFRPAVLDAMLPWLTAEFGNPSGSHALSRRARQAVDEAREVVAASLGCEPGEVVFTGGGTEADNLAIAGVVGATRRKHEPAIAVCSAVEHHAVLHAVEAVGGTVVAVDQTGRIDLAALRGALGPDVAVVSVMLANNEVGTVQPLAEVAAVVRALAPRAVVHTDAVQAFPWLDVASLAQPADLVAIAAHKFGGPKGVGALAVRGGVALDPMLRGGGQERDRRSGTHNVAGIVGMAEAMRQTVALREETSRRVRRLRDELADRALVALDGVAETGHRSRSLPNICHLRIAGVESESLLMLLDAAGVYASAGSACASGAMEPSHVLSAMGIERAECLSSIRLSLGWPTTDVDIQRGADALISIVARLRSASVPA